MASKGRSTRPSSRATYNILETDEICDTALNRVVTWNLARVPLTNIELNPFNNRISPDHAMSVAEHKREIVNEDKTAFDNLEKSLRIYPQFEQLIGYTVTGKKKIKLIGGHRRYFAAQQAGKETLLVWITQDLTDEEVEHVRDWPEIHRSKVAHSSYAKMKMIHADLHGRSEIERERRVRVWQQKGYSRAGVFKAARVVGRMQQICKEQGRTPADCMSQVKTFEAYDQLCETSFQKLRDTGDFVRLTLVDKIAKSYIRHEIAHDDLRVGIEGLIDLPLKDPFFRHVQEDPSYLEDKENLRRLTNDMRNDKNSRGLLKDLEAFNSRLLVKINTRADLKETEQCLAEYTSVVAQLETILTTMKRGG